MTSYMLWHCAISIAYIFLLLNDLTLSYILYLSLCTDSFEISNILLVLLHIITVPTTAKTYDVSWWS